MVTPDGVRNEWDDIVDEVIGPLSLLEDDGDAYATGATSSSLPVSGAPRTSSAVSTTDEAEADHDSSVNGPHVMMESYPATDDGKMCRENYEYGHGDESLGRRSITSSCDSYSLWSQAMSHGSCNSIGGSPNNPDSEDMSDDSDGCSSYSTAVTVEQV